jgi:hypothetical protein
MARPHNDLVELIASERQAADSVAVNTWSDPDWLTLQLGPVWVASALIGRCHFNDLEEAAFWHVLETSESRSPLSWRLKGDAVANREWLLREFLVDDRSIVTGLTQVASLLDAWVPADVSREAREWMLVVGSRFARARGPFGQRISDSDAQMLQLLTQLLETTAETAEDNPLNAAAAI